jgi:hypothetical protein
MTQPTQPDQNPAKRRLEWMTRNIDMTGTGRSTEEINAIRQSLDEQETATRARMPERIFVGLWLAVFHKGQNEFYPQVNLDMWANYAGNEYREVDIINAKGEVLFSVPPLFDRSGIKAIQGKDRTRMPGGNILNIIRNAELRSRVSPQDGRNYLSAHLKQRALFMADLPPSVRTNLERWDAIFKRYGLPGVLETEEVTAQKDSVSNSADQPTTQNDEWEPL